MKRKNSYECYWTMLSIRIHNLWNFMIIFHKFSLFMKISEQNVSFRGKNMGLQLKLFCSLYSMRPWRRITWCKVGNRLRPDRLRPTDSHCVFSMEVHAWTDWSSTMNTLSHCFVAWSPKKRIYHYVTSFRDHYFSGFRRETPYFQWFEPKLVLIDRRIVNLIWFTNRRLWFELI